MVKLNVYQVRQGFQDFVILKVTKLEIQEVFPKLNAKASKESGYN